MAKAINWPETYRAYWLAAPADARVHLALRLGDLYFTNQYWVPDEIVDLRVGHKIVRSAVIAGELRQMPVEEFSGEELAALPPDLQTPDAVVAFLALTYSQPVTLQTPVTLVPFRLLAVDLDKVEK